MLVWMRLERTRPHDSTLYWWAHLWNTTDADGMPVCKGMTLPLRHWIRVSAADLATCRRCPWCLDFEREMQKLTPDIKELKPK